MKKIVVFGAGAVGGSVGGWIASTYPEVYFFDSAQVLNGLKRFGISLYRHGQKDRVETIPVKTISNLNDISDPDIVVIAVKNYSLEDVSKLVQAAYKNNPIVVGLQNGIENQKILPKYFKRIIYGVVSFNAWVDDLKAEKRVIGFQKRGPIVIGTLDNSLQEELREVQKIFSLGLETVVTDHFLDAAHCKMVVNLTNSFTTLVGHHFREISDADLFQKLLTNLTYEGVQILRENGFKEVKLGGMPSWMMMKAAVKLPMCVTRSLFKKNIKKMVLSSMAQDILQRGGTETELESLNGYFIKLADLHSMKVPYNRAVYQLCKNAFSKSGFQPLDVREVYQKVVEKI